MNCTMNCTLNVPGQQILKDVSQSLLDHRQFDNSLVAIYIFIKNFLGTSGSSTVAIDNKIEQAMDLVKSHLMFAVREEVEVLKERITELMERIGQLEYENNILKAGAPPETLAQLTTTQPHSQAPPPSS